MKKLFFVISFCFLGFMAQAQISPLYNVEEIVLENGLTVWLNIDHTMPQVYGAVAVKAGAKDCPNTGIAHYFEHMMFKGTQHIGTTDYAAEKVYLDRISAKYDELSTLTDDSLRNAVQKEINALSIQASDYVIPNEFSNLISKYGGTMLNAGTSYDFTCYYNVFQPNYFEQWAELNSERLITPVFRMFQSELETVYEEKNMYSDQLGGQLSEKMLGRVFEGHPYSYPIVGSTENLKNPRLSDMRRFFEQYYVASNMVLILSGDIDKETFMPIIERCFSRVPAGVAPEYQSVELKPFNGRETFEMLLPVPLLKMSYVLYRGPKAADADNIALNVVCALLSNENKTGYLDLLVSEGQFMEAAVVPQSLNDAGMIMSVVVPKLTGMSYDKAEQLFLQQVERIKNGDFTDEFLEAVKMKQMQDYKTELESLEGRAMSMIMAYTSNQKWEIYLNEVNAIESLTRDDIVKVAQKYFGPNYLFGYKKMGNYDAERVEKPGFAPIVPKNTMAHSDFSKMLDTIPIKKENIRFIDFDADVHTTNLSDNVKLYTNANPMNDVFTFTLRFGIGSTIDQRLEYAAQYLDMLGTDSMSRDAFNASLQNIGATMSFAVSDDHFEMNLSGPDQNFEAIVSLGTQFLNQVKADKSKYKKMLTEAKMGKLTFDKSNDMIADAMREKIIYDNNSRFINHMTLKQLKKTKPEAMIEALNNAMDSKWEVFYCGNLNEKDVEKTLHRQLPLDKASAKGGVITYRITQQYDKPIVYFYNFPDSKQTMIYSYVKGENSNRTAKDKATATLFTNYFSGGMSSLLFQEIREYRSLAYGVGGYYKMPSSQSPNQSGFLMTMLSTQVDKTLDAMNTLDSLTRYMPFASERLVDALQLTANDIEADYPNFRQIAKTIANYQAQAYTEDPNKAMFDFAKSLTIKDIKKFQEQNIRSKEVIYIVIGDKSKIDMDKLIHFGEVKELKSKDIYIP